jgi:hypothetical protein
MPVDGGRDDGRYPSRIYDITVKLASNFCLRNPDETFDSSKLRRARLSVRQSVRLAWHFVTSPFLHTSLQLRPHINVHRLHLRISL